MPLLSVENLSVFFTVRGRQCCAVDHLSFNLEAGECLGIVGESGSGKTQAALGMLGLLANNGFATGTVRFRAKDLLQLEDNQLNAIRGAEISMVFQDPLAALNPYLKISTQMTEILIRHRGMGFGAALETAIRCLDRVYIPDARSRIRSYPHEFSGGMRQRVMIAMALLCAPRLLIADEPTTALDVTVQAQILGLFQELRRDRQVAILFISHDLGVIGKICDRVLVMYAGKMMEYGVTGELFDKPYHPYTKALLASIPRLDTDQPTRLQAIPGHPPELSTQWEGCPFSDRCDRSFNRCHSIPLAIKRVEPNRQVACHLELP